MGRQYNIIRKNVDGCSMTPGQETVYKCLKRQYYPKSPKEIGAKTGKSPENVWRYFNGNLKNKGMVEKAKRGEYYVVGSRAQNNRKKNRTKWCKR